MTDSKYQIITVVLYIMYTLYYDNDKLVKRF